MRSMVDGRRLPGACRPLPAAHRSTMRQWEMMTMASRDGNGWVRCELGHRHWGRFGAAGLLAYVLDGPVLLQQRTWWSHHGGTWGLPGGARDSHEAALAAALREAAEECGVPPGSVRQRGVFTDDHGGWSYTSVLAQAAEPFPVFSDDDESEEVGWVGPGDVGRLDLHPGFGAHWHELRAELSPVTIIVDAANVMGSRPDGWWRDRAGAAVRLKSELVPLAREGITNLPGGMAGSVVTDRDAVPQPPRKDGGSARAASVRSRSPITGYGPPPIFSYGLLDGGDADDAGVGQTRMRWMPEVVLVVEGAARPAVELDADVTQSDAAGAVSVVAAPGSGDDTIARLAAQTTGRRIVVTADRELRQRSTAAGASVAGPSWLLGLL